jgi:hypothetical protein
VRGLVGVEKEGGVRQCGDRHSFISGAGWSEGGGVRRRRDTRRRAGRGPTWAWRTAREGPGGAENWARRGQRRAGGAGGRGSGWHAWATHAVVGRPRKGGAGPGRAWMNNDNFDLFRRISN